MTASSQPALTRERLHEVLWLLVAKHTDRDPQHLRPEHRLQQDLGADSLTVVELTMAVEEELGITLPETLLDNPNLTVGELEAAIAALHR